MATVVLVRHGRSTANTAGVLAGRTPGVLLDEIGVAQAVDVGQRLSVLPLAAIVSSPLERCQQTAEAVAQAQKQPLDVAVDDRLTECGYGDWTGQELKGLAKKPLWRVVQGHPSAAVFPSGESLRAMQARGIEAIRAWDASVTEQHGPESVWVAVSHADVIKAILADALGTHLDNFQRIVVDPASVSVISYTELRPFVVRCNEHGDVAGLVPSPKRKRRKASARSRSTSSDAVVGGGAGS